MKKCMKTSVGLLIIFVLIMTVLSAKARDHLLEIQFFYNNACASCKEDEKIFELFNKCLTPEEKSRVTYEIRTYNTFQPEDKKKFEEVCVAAKNEQDGQLPVLIVGSKWIWGYEDIEKNLKEVFFSESQKNADEASDIAAGNSSEQADRVTENSNVESEAAEVNTLIAQLKRKNKNPEQNFVVYFSTYSCSDCEKVKAFLLDNGAGDKFELNEYNIAEANHVMLVQEFFRQYQVPKENQKVPALFYGDSYLTGVEDICDRFLEDLDGGKAQFEDFDRFVSVSADHKTDKGVTGKDFFTFALSGFLAGFNPCAVSMLLMLLSILLTTDTSVLKSGLLYLAGKYITYFAIGAGIYYAVSWIDQGAFAAARTAINIGITVLFLIAAVFYFIDYWNVRKKEYGKIRMQLPAKLRGWNHRLIKRVHAARPMVLLFVVFGLGIAISLGEFFCTGQIYMANILYLMKHAAGNIFWICLLFVIYVTFMCLPSFVFILIISRTKNVNRVSGFMLRHMGAVKLFNAALFLGFAVYFLLL